MAVSNTHAFTNPKADGADATIVRPSDWNAEHVLEMATDRLLGRTTAGDGAVEEITVGTGLNFAAGQLSATASTNYTFDTVTTLLADTSDYTDFSEGDYLNTRKEGFSYEVAATGASDHHVETAGGLKLYVLPTGGCYNIMAFGAAGDGVVDDTEVVKTACAAAYSLYFPAGTYKLTETLNIKRQIHLYGDVGTQSAVYPSILYYAETDIVGLILHNGATFASTSGVPTLDGSGGAGSAGGSIIERLYFRRGVSAQALPIDDISHGIVFKTRARVQDCLIAGWAGDGIHINATASSGDPYTQGNANNWDVAYCRMATCRHGLYVNGADGNAGSAWHVDCSANAEYGFYDSSFLGNTYFACHTNGNDLGGYFMDSDNAGCVYINCYSEQGQGDGNVLLANAIVLGDQVMSGTSDAETIRFTNGSTNFGARDFPTEAYGSITGSPPVFNAWNIASPGGTRGASYGFKIGPLADFAIGGKITAKTVNANTYGLSILELSTYNGLPASTIAITGITQAAQGVITTSGAHGLVEGDRVVVQSVVGMTELNNRSYYVDEAPSATTLTLETMDDGDPVDTSAYTAYVSGGTIGEPAGYIPAITITGNLRVTPGSNDTFDFGSTSLAWKTGYFTQGLRLTEQTAPSAPAADTGILFLQDNGAGKTQLMIRFATGAAQQVAIEP
jgi:hypothetical protein